MAGSVNKVILIGNLGADPEVRHTQDGRPIVNLRLATSESWRDKASGERKERTEWHRVVIFSEPLCRVAEQYLKKGSEMCIRDRDGRPIVNLRMATSESWRDKASGERKERTEWHRVVIFLSLIHI